MIGFGIFLAIGAGLLVGAARRLLRRSGRLAEGGVGRCGRAWRFPDNSRFDALNGNLNSRFGGRQIFVKPLIYRENWTDSGQTGRIFPVISRLDGNFAALTALYGNSPLRRRPLAPHHRPSGPALAASPGQGGAFEPEAAAVIPGAAILANHPKESQSARPSRRAVIGRFGSREAQFRRRRGADGRWRQLQYQPPRRRRRVAARGGLLRHSRGRRKQNCAQQRSGCGGRQAYHYE